MALAHASLNDALHPSHGLEQEGVLYEQLINLQRDIVDGKRPQFQLPASAVEQLKASLASLQSAKDQNSRLASVTSTSGHPSRSAITSDLDPIFLQEAPVVVQAKRKMLRERIERELFQQYEQRKQIVSSEKEGFPDHIDLDVIMTEAHNMVPHVSGLRSLMTAQDDKSSFDENDYYSSQVESDYAPNGVPLIDQSQAFTADYLSLYEGTGMLKKRKLYAADNVHSKSRDRVSDAEEIEAEDEYIPQEATNGPDDDDDDAYHKFDQLSHPDIGEASEYEPGEVSQNDDSSIEYAPPSVAAQSPQVQVVRNQLTQIAAPQPNRVSPLAVHKNQNYELELVNGKPEMVRKARLRRDADQARQSSASPPVTNGRMRKAKNKKRKRELDQQQAQQNKSKRRDRRGGLDTSAQYPQDSIKDEPLSPALYTHKKFGDTAMTHISPTHYVQQDAYTPVVLPYGSALAPTRSSSVMPSPAVRGQQDLRRVATIHQAQVQPGYQPYAPAGPYGDTSRGAIPPHAAHDQFMPPPPTPPRRMAIDQFGNRYYATEPEPAPVRASVVPEPSRYIDQAISRAQSAYEPAAYDPADARIDYAHTSHRVAVTPSYALNEAHLAKVRPEDPRRYSNAPTSPVFQHHTEYGSSSSSHRYESMPAPPLPPQYMDTSRQSMPPPQYLDTSRQSMPPPPPMYAYDQSAAAPGRPYSAHPGYAQPTVVAYQPTQGSIAPIQYIRQSVQPQPQPQARAMSVMPIDGAMPSQYPPAYAYAQAQPPVRYIDANGYEVR